MGLDEIRYLIDFWYDCPPLNEQRIDKLVIAACGLKTDDGPSSGQAGGRSSFEETPLDMVASSMGAPHCGPLPPEVRDIFDSIREDLRVNGNPCHG